ncbi:MAG: amino acid adenylation domain-containing protein, partial [Acidobacteriota bacterium]
PNLSRELSTLSYAQQRLWFLEQLMPDNIAYNIPAVISIKGNLNIDALEHSFNEVIRRHDLLRAAFIVVAGEPMQQIVSALDFRLTKLKLPDLPEPTRHQEIQNIILSQIREPFNLSVRPLLRVTLITIEENEHLLILVIHHIISDGWSMGVLIKEIAALYQAFSTNQPHRLPELAFQYRDFIHWQNEQLGEERLQTLLNYWRGRLTMETPLLQLPFDYPRPTIQSYRGAQQTLFLSPELSIQLKELSKREKVTLFVLLLAAFKAWLYHYTGQSDITIGTPSANRDRDEFKNLIGFFVNTLVLRTDLSATDTFHELVQRVRETSVEAFAHRDLPFEKLVEALRPDRHLNRAPLVQVGFTLQKLPLPLIKLDDLCLTLQDIDPGTAKLDLNLTMEESSEGLKAIMEYSTDLFNPTTVIRMLNEYRIMLEGLIAQPNIPIAALLTPLSVRTRERVDPYLSSNLTRNQLLIWLGQRIQPDIPIYNMVNLFKIDREIDPIHFQRAWQTLINSSDVLRTVFHEKDGVPQQRILSNVVYEMELLDLTEVADAYRELSHWISERCRRSFDFGKPLFDSVLIKLPQKKSAWYLTMHQIIIDHWSVAIIFRQMDDFYQKSLVGQLSIGVDLPQFSSFIDYQHRLRESAYYQTAQVYWQKKLARRFEPVTFYGKLPIKKTSQVERISCQIGPERTWKLKEIARQKQLFTKTINATLFNIFAALLAAYLYRSSGNHSFSIGAAFHNRRTETFKEMIGPFMEVLPLHINVNNKDTFVSLIEKITAEASETLHHRQFPIGNPIHNRAYEIFLNFHTVTYTDFHGANVSAKWLHTGYEDDCLALQVLDLAGAGNLSLHFDLHCDVFESGLRQRVVEHFLRVFDAFLIDINQSLDQISLFAPGEKEHILVQTNITTKPFPFKQTIARLFELQAEKTPEQIAVICQGQSLSYAELNIRSNQLARYLRSLGVSAESVIGLCVDRSLNLPIGLLGILKAGAAYLPLDPAYPKQRLTQMIEEAGVPLILTQQKLIATIPVDTAKIVCLDSEWPAIATNCAENLDNCAHTENLAYIIYTSGSSGQPKGVMVTQRSIINHAFAMIPILKLVANDRVFQFHSISFDAAAEEIFPCWMSGATLVLQGDEIAFGSELLKILDSSGITILNLPTSYWHEWVSELSQSQTALPGSLRLVIVGGEKALPERYTQWRKISGDKIEWLNTYGPSETTITATFYQTPKDSITIDDNTELPIGIPISNVQIYILDEKFQPVPIAVPGQLYIGGEGIARGYLNHTELTAERFVPDPFNGQPGARLYCTGDLAHWKTDGNIQFLGRVDNQVKIRGFRIELGEIIATLSNHPAVHENIVIVREDRPNDKRLIAYVVVEKKSPPTINELRNFLKQRLPEYMIPSTFVMLDRLPLTVSGKIDRQALPPPDRYRPELTANYIAPKTETEQRIVEVWRKVLGLEKIGTQDNFFDLGGHSLLMAQVQSRLQSIVNCQLPLIDLFKYPTIAMLANHLDQQPQTRATAVQFEERAKKQRQALNRFANVKLRSKKD